MVVVHVVLAVYLVEYRRLCVSIVALALKCFGNILPNYWIDVPSTLLMVILHLLDPIIDNSPLSILDGHCNVSGGFLD